MDVPTLSLTTPKAIVGMGAGAYAQGGDATPPSTPLALLLGPALARRTRRVEQTLHGRAGNFFYVEAGLHIRFEFELCGMHTKMVIDLPEAAAWQDATDAPLYRRDEIVEYLAATVQAAFAPQWAYEIRRDSIVFR